VIARAKQQKIDKGSGFSKDAVLVTLSVCVCVLVYAYMLVCVVA